MKKGFVFILSIAMAFILCGCCLSHDWVEANCTAPKTCSKCEQTEGEPLGHQWQEATCTEPKTCTICGETSGKSSGHLFSAYTIQEADFMNCTATFVRTCKSCGEESTREGELTQFTDQGVFLMTPEEFSDRFTQALMDMPLLMDYDLTTKVQYTCTDLYKLMGDDQYLSFVSDDTMSYDLTMYMTKRDSRGNIKVVGEFEMRDSEDHFMSNDQKNESRVLWKISGKVQGKDSAAVAMLALYRAADPGEWEKFIGKLEGKIALSLFVESGSTYRVSTELDSFSTQKTQNICYEITPQGGNTYEFTITAR